MAKLKVSVDVPISPDKAWSHASDLPELDKWLILHEGWRGPVPEGLTPGTRLIGVATVKGFRNRVTWVVKTAEPPNRLVLDGSGIGGTKFGIELRVSATSTGSKVTADFDLGGAPLFGPIGSVVARALRGDVERSLDRFVQLYG